MQTLCVHKVGLSCGDLWSGWTRHIEVLSGSFGMSLVKKVDLFPRSFGLTITMEQVMVTAAMAPWEMVSLL